MFKTDRKRKRKEKAYFLFEKELAIAYKCLYDKQEKTNYLRDFL